MDYDIFVGLAGDTDEGRFLSAGLWRSRNGAGPWESIGHRLGGELPVRAILADARHAGRVTIGTATGIWRSDDRGDTWRRLPAPAPGLSVWSLARHPGEPDTILAGYEPGAVAISRDDGASWRLFPIEATFPDVTRTMPKRVLGLAVDPASTDDIYAGIEIGGMVRSRDGGRTWVGITDGTYINEDSVDFHSVAVSRIHPGRITGATRIGTFRSDDGGAHWRDMQIPMLRPRGTYCRVLAYDPEEAETLYLAGGNDFDGDIGRLFISRDDGSSWEVTDCGSPLKTSLFGLAVNARLTSHVFCASKIGQVLVSPDRGRSWRASALPPGAGHVFALAAG